MLSLLAMAAPMVAFANADASSQVKYPTGKDVLASDKKGQVSQKLEGLAPGEYIVSLKGASNPAVKLLVNGAESKDGKFTIKAGDAVTIGATIDGKTGFTTAFTVTLVWNFAQQASELQAKLKTVINNIDKDRDELNDLAFSKEASKIQLDITSNVKDEGGYEAYSKYKLYDANNNDFIVRINQLAAKVGDSKGIKSLYEYGITAVDEVTNQLTTAKTQYDGSGTYTKNHEGVKGVYEAIQADIDKYKQTLEAAYKAGKVDDNATVDAWKDAIVARINAYTEAMNTATKNDNAYQEVKTEYEKVKALYSETLARLVAKDAIYGDSILNQARGELSAALQTAKGILASDKNGSEDSHDNAANTKTANLKLLEGQTQKIKASEAKAFSRSDAYKAADTHIKGVRKEFDSRKNLEYTKTDKANDISTLEAKITALENDIDSQYKNLTIDDFVKSTKYSESASDIDKLMADFKPAADNLYKNWQDANTIKDLLDKMAGKLAKAKEEAGKLKNKNEGYEAVSQYAVEYDKLNATIGNYKSKASYYDRRRRSTEYLANNKADFEATSAAIDTYLSYAKETSKQYDAIVDNIKTYTNEVDALDALVLNKDVEVADDVLNQLKDRAEGNTYAAQIAGLKTRIKTLQTALDKAVAEKSDAKKHRDAIMGIVSDNETTNISTDTKTLTDSYEGDALQAAAVKMVATAKNDVLAKETKINDKKAEYESKKVEIGIQQPDFIEALEAIDFTEINKEIDEADKNKLSDPASAIAVLEVVNKQLNDIDAKLAKIEADVQKRITAVKENNEKFTEVNKLVKATLKKLTDNKELITGADQDVNKVAGLTAEYNRLNGEMGGLQKAVNASKAAETLVADWKKTQEATHKELAGKIDSLVTLADKDLKNWNAYTKLKEAYEDKSVDEALTAAANAVAAINGRADYGYFNAELKKLTDEKVAIKKAIDDDYADIEHNDPNSDKSGIKKRINDMKYAANGMKGKITANKKAYDAQKTAIDAAEKKIKDVKEYIEKTDETSKMDDFLQQLEALQTKLEGYKTQHESDFKAGKSADALTNQIKQVTTDAEEIRQAQEAGYDAAIRQDNDARFNSFNTVKERTEGILADTKRKIQDLRDIKDSELKASINQIVEANDIYKYSALIEVLNDKAVKEYDNCKKGEFYDPGKENEKLAKQYGEEIDQTWKKLIDAVDSTANALLTNLINTADAKVQTAKNDLTGYNYKVRNNAFSEARKTVSEAREFQKTFGEEFFACNLDQKKHLGNLKGIDAQIEAGKEPAAVAEWEYRRNVAERTKTSNITAIQSWIDSSAKLEQSYLDAYNKVVADYFDKAVANAEAAIESKNLYGGKLDVCKTLLAQFTTEAGTAYGNARARYNALFDFEAGCQFIEACLKAGDNSLEAQLDAATAHAKSYMAVTETEDVTQNTIVNTLEAINSQLDNVQEEYRKIDQVLTLENYPAIYTECYNLQQSIEGLYISSNQEEYDVLSQRKTALYAEVEDALKTFAGTSKEAALKDIKTTIMGYDTELDKCFKGDRISVSGVYRYDVDKCKENKANWVALENKMAATSAELTIALKTADYIDQTGTVVDEPVNKVATQYTEAQATLEKTHKAVKESEKALSFAKVGTDIEQLKARVQSYKDARTIMFYKDNVLTEVSILETKIESFLTNIQNLDEKWNKHDKAYDRLLKENQGYSEKIAALEKKMLGFKHVNTVDIDTRDAIKQLVDDNTTDLTEKQVNAEKKGELLDVTSQLKNTQYNGTALATAIVDLDKKATYTETEFWLADSLTNDLKRLTNLIENTEGRLYANDAELRQGIAKVRDKVTNAKAYNDAAQTGLVDNDIDGKEIKNGKHIDYLGAEGSELVFARINELDKKVRELEASAEDNQYWLGDVAKEYGVVRSNDYVTMRSWLTQGLQTWESFKNDGLALWQFKAADANQDGEFNVADLARVVTLFEGSEGTMTVRHAPRQVSDAIDVNVVSNGETKRIAISLKNSVAYVGGQMDIELPVGLEIVGESVSNRANGHELTSATLADGKHRVVISSIENAEFTDTEEAVLYLEVAGKGDLSKLTVDQIVFTDAAGIAYHLPSFNANGQATGINGIKSESSLSSKIYDAAGRLVNTLKKGINIIRNSDGSTQKVIKK